MGVRGYLLKVLGKFYLLLLPFHVIDAESRRLSALAKVLGEGRGEAGVLAVCVKCFASIGIQNFLLYSQCSPMALGQSPNTEPEEAGHLGMLT